MTVRRGRRAATGFLRDFQDFILKGNVVELAIAVIIGGAFGKIITSFTDNIIMPLLNPLVARAGGNWREWTIPPGIGIGSFLGSVVDFLIIAFALFVALRLVTRFQRKAEEAPPPPSERECPYCLTQVPIAARRCRACTSDLAPLDPLA